MMYLASAYFAPNWWIEPSMSLTASLMQIATVHGLRISQLHTESEHPQGPWLVYCDDEIVGSVVCQ